MSGAQPSPARRQLVWEHPAPERPAEVKVLSRIASTLVARTPAPVHRRDEKGGFIEQ
jgi:hypothetical protein